MFDLNIKNIQIPVIFEEDHFLKVVFLKLVFKNSGKAYEGKIAGLANMFARILNEGVNEDFYKELELRAINLYANSGFESFEINITCLKEHFEFMMKKLKILLENPWFDEKILQRNKNILLGEIASKKSDFDFVAKTLLNSSVFEYDEFQTPLEGDERSIKELSLSELKSFYAEHFSLKNLIVVVGGDLSQKELSKELVKTLENLPLGKSLKEKHFELNKKKKDEICVRKESEQAYIYFSTPFKASVKDKDLHLAKIALFILGAGGFGSRVMEEIRVKNGLAYSAYASLELKNSYTRVFGYLQTKNENAVLAKNLLKEIFEKFVKEGVSELEFTQAKNFLIGSMPLRYESLEKRLNIALSEFYAGLELGYFKKELEKIEATSLKELNSYIKNHGEILQMSFASVQNEA